MKKNSEKLSRLFQAYYEKKLSPEETDELFQLLNRESDDEQLNALIQQAWLQLQEEHPHYTTANSGIIFNSMLEDIHHRRDDRSEEPLPAKLFTLKRVAAAAIVILLAGAAYFLFRQTPHTAQTASTLPVVVDTDSLLYNKVVLRLANGSVIELDTLKTGTTARQGNIAISKATDGQVLYKVADSVAGFAANGINTISTPNGGRYQVQLQDGTKVWLNAMSSLRFPVSFEGNERRVSITGEVYFDVMHNSRLPFIVMVNGFEIHDLGTQFNVNAYTDEPAVKTTLIEGKVIVKSEQSVVLKPGEQAVLTADSRFTIADADVEKVMAWKDNLFNFKDAGIEEVMRQAARWYNIKVHYEGKIPSNEFNGKISRALKLPEFLEILRYKGINVSVNGEHITIIN